MAVVYDGPDYSEQDIEVVQRPNLLYPSGRVLYTDNFDSPVNGWSTGGSGGHLVQLKTTSVFSPPAAMYLQTSAAIGAYAQFYKYIGIPGSKKIGIQTTFSIVEFADGVISFRIWRYDGATLHNPSVQYDTANDKWQYVDSAGATQDLAGGSQTLRIGSRIYHSMKVVVDLENDKYVRLYCNGLNVDMSALSSQASVDATDEGVLIEMRITSAENVAMAAHVDNLAITEED